MFKEESANIFQRLQEEIKKSYRHDNLEPSQRVPKNPSTLKTFSLKQHLKETPKSAPPDQTLQLESLLAKYRDYTNKLDMFTDSLDCIKVMYALKTLHAQVQYLLHRDSEYP